MNFLNAWLLAGAAAMVAPLLIHLLNRSQYRTVSWGAMHLLDAALESNARRVQWESWLLLLIRCLIPVLLAVTLARPVLTRWQSAEAHHDASLTLLIDNSLSMAAGDQGESLLARAARELTAIARQSSGAQLELWSTAGPIRQVMTAAPTNLPRLAAALQRIGPAAGVSWPSDILQLSSQLSATPSAAGRQIILASDFQAALWSQVSENELQAVRNQLTASELPTQLFLLPLRTSGSAANLSVHFEDTPSSARLDQPYQTIVRVTNHGSQSVDDVDVTFQVGGQDLSNRTLQLPAGASEQVPFACEFTELGWQSLSVQLSESGPVRGDDRCFHAVRVVAPARVLIIDDSLSPIDVRALSTNSGGKGSFSGASRYLRLALAPFEEQQQNPFLLTHARANDVSSDTLAGHAVVVIAQLDAPTSELSEKLAMYVDAGGGLLLFSPIATKAAFGSLLADRSPPWLPLRWGRPQTASESAAAKLVAKVSPPGADALEQALVNGAASFEFTRWWELTPRENSAAVQVMARLNNGDPWLVELNRGRGVVIQCASDCADDGSNLPSQSAYVPLMLSLTEHLASRANRSAPLTSGQSVDFQIIAPGPQKQPAMQPLSAFGDRLSVRRVMPAADDKLPARGSSQVWEVPAQQARAVFTETRLPGIYQPQLLATEGVQATVEPGLISINTPQSESQILSLSRAELQSLAGRLGATLIESPADYVRSEKVRREGWEFWRWMLLAVLGLLFAELLIGLRGTPNSTPNSLRGA